MSKRLIITGMSGLVAVAFLASSPAAAESVTNSMKKMPGIMMAHERDAVAGTVASVNGNIFTVNEERNASSSVLYTIDASNAKVFSNGATSTISEIQTGDKVFIKGKISGTNVTANVVVEGAVNGILGKIKIRHVALNASTTPKDKIISRFFPLHASTTDPLRGNFTLGNVTAVNGTSFTVEDKGRRDVATTTYTVITDGSTVFKKAAQSGSLSDVTVGQFVMVAGAKNSANDTITATSVNVVSKMPERIGERGLRPVPVGGR